MRRILLPYKIRSVYRLLREAEPQDFTKYSEHFNELSFAKKLERVGQFLGDTVLLPILRLYFILQSRDVPKTGKLYIIGALGYFILPIDMLPDFLPGLLGFSDDLIVVSIVLKQVRKFSTPEIEAKAQRLMHRICPCR
ncbi:MAG: DUF1232 domain-containing protein [Porphyromonas sp.]|nr:DUF1232 domain-containing protein [Porphyromonas sp.]